MVFYILCSPYLMSGSATFSQITEGVKPTLSELEKFEDQPEGIDLEVVTETAGTVSQFICVLCCHSSRLLLCSVG